MPLTGGEVGAFRATAAASLPTPNRAVRPTRLLLDMARGNGSEPGHETLADRSTQATEPVIQ